MTPLTTKAQRKIFGAIILVLLIWPGGHRLLAHYGEINPWKLCGFAMYCIEHMLGVSVNGGHNGQFHELGSCIEGKHFKTQLSQEEKNTLKQYWARRRILGRLASPKALATRIARGHPELETIVIVVVVRRLSGQTSRLEMSERAYEYRREELLAH